MNNNTKKDKNVLRESLAYVKKITKITFSIIMGMIILFLVYFLFSALIASKTGTVPKLSLDVILTGSMAPNINVNDVVLSVRVDDPSTIRDGDIITFISTSSISRGLRVTHRVIERRIVNGEYQFVTQGDNNTAPDTDTAKASDLIGKVTLRIPQLGRLKSLLLDWRGWVIIILLPAATIIIYDIIKLTKIIKAKKRSESVEEGELSLEELTKQEEDKKIEEAIQNIKRSAPVFIEPTEPINNPTTDNLVKEEPISIETNEEEKIEESIDKTELIILPENVIPFNQIKEEIIVEEKTSDLFAPSENEFMENVAVEDSLDDKTELSFDEQILNDAIERMKAAHQKEVPLVHPEPKIVDEINFDVIEPKEKEEQKLSETPKSIKTHIDRPFRIEQTYKYYGDDEAYFEKPLDENANKIEAKSRIERIVNTYTSEDYKTNKIEKTDTIEETSNENRNNHNRSENNFNNNSNRRRNNRNRNRNRNRNNHNQHRNNQNRANNR